MVDGLQKVTKLEREINKIEETIKKQNQLRGKKLAELDKAKSTYLMNLLVEKQMSLADLAELLDDGDSTTTIVKEGD